MKEIHSTKYPSLGTMYGFWHKSLNPALSIIILSIIVLAVFILGVWFMRKYAAIWQETETKGTYQLEYPQNRLK